MAVDVPLRRLTKPTTAPVRVSADIAVVGAGAAGWSAALAAARAGRRTVLIDAESAPGGQMVGALLGTICGLYSNGKRPYRVTYGAAGELLAHLAGEGALAVRRARNSDIVQYDETAAGRWIERALAAAGVRLLPGAVLRGVARDGRRIASLDLATRWGDVAVAATGFVDASGDAALAWHAGLAVREPVRPIQGSQIVVLENIDEAALAAIDRWNMQAVLKDKAAAYGLRRHDGFAFLFPGRGVAAVNMTHMETPTDPLGAGDALLDGREQADRVLAFLRAEFPAALGRARIRAYGRPGIRQTRWIVGARQLTAAAVRAGTRADDAVARCAWPIELHDRPEGVHWEEFGDDHMHYVPLGAMVPAETDNLVAAGRCIDGDAAALSSVRVMGPCMAMGEAAAAALDLAGAGSLHQIDRAALARRLADNLDRADRDPWNSGG
jgi:hypothetical protein